MAMRSLIRWTQSLTFLVVFWHFGAGKNTRCQQYRYWPVQSAQHGCWNAGASCQFYWDWARWSGRIEVWSSDFISKTAGDKLAALANTWANWWISRPKLQDPLQPRLPNKPLGRHRHHPSFPRAKLPNRRSLPRWRLPNRYLSREHPRFLKELPR